MRELFLSEQRYIRNILLQNVGREWSPRPTVLSEYHAPPRTGAKRPYFNADFVLRFVEPAVWPEHKSFCARVLPNTLGAEVFLTVNAATGQPLMTELDSGEAFPLKYFRRFTDEVERELAKLNAPMRFQASSYCRVFVVGSDICFLSFLDDILPSTRGNRLVLRDDGDASVISYVVGEQFVCVDGWMKTDVPSSDRFLVAEPLGDV